MTHHKSKHLHLYANICCKFDCQTKLVNIDIENCDCFDLCKFVSASKQKLQFTYLPGAVDYLRVV